MFPVEHNTVLWQQKNFENHRFKNIFHSFRTFVDTFYMTKRGTSNNDLLFVFMFSPNAGKHRSDPTIGDLTINSVTHCKYH